MRRCPFSRLLSAALLTAVLLSSMSSVSCADATVEEASALRLFIATDTHYIAPALTDHGIYFRQMVENADGKYMLQCEELTDAFVRQVIREKPDALILSGDLSFNGALESHLAFAEKLCQIREAGVPVFVIPGNHDLNYPMAAAFHGDSFTLVASVTPEDFSEIYNDFGYWDAIARDGSSLSYVAELSEEFLLLMVDVNTPSAPGSLTEETLQWAREQLVYAQNTGRKVIAVSHQTLLEHAFLSPGIVMYGWERLLSLYEEYGVVCNLCGHMHVQHIKLSDSGFPDIAGSALITWPNQFGVLELDRGEARYATERVDTSSFAGFDAAALRFLQETNRRQVAAELRSLLVEDPGNELRDYLVLVNAAYVAGRGDTLDWNSPFYECWQSVPSLYAYYLRTIREDGRNHTVLSFSY